MGAITFQSLHGSASVDGSERFLMAALVNRCFYAMLRNDGDYNDPIVGFWPADSVIRRTTYAGRGSALVFQRDFELAAISMVGHLLNINGVEEWTSIAAANTAFALRSNSLTFAARCHMQCEIHGYVEGPYRNYLADVIEQATADGILRKPLRVGHQWSDVVALLRERDDEPVVTSHSTRDDFPSAIAASWDTGDDGNDECFYALPVATQWELALRQIRSDSGLEWRPDIWLLQRFGNRQDAFTIRAAGDSIAQERARGPQKLLQR